MDALVVGSLLLLVFCIGALAVEWRLLLPPSGTRIRLNAPGRLIPLDLVLLPEERLVRQVSSISVAQTL